MRRITPLIAFVLVGSLLPASARPPVAPAKTTREVRNDGLAGTGDADVRALHLRGPLPSAVAAARALHRRVPDLAVKWNARMGTAKTVQSDSGYLTGPVRLDGDAAAERLARSWISANRALFGLSDANVRSLSATRVAALPNGGAWALVFRVMHGSIPTFAGGTVGVNIARDGRIAFAWADTGPDAAFASKPKISAADALAAVARRENVRTLSIGVRAALPAGDRLTIFEAGGAYARHNARLVAFPTAAGPRLAWRVFFAKAGDEMLSTAVDALTGVVLFRHNQVQRAEGDEGRVFRNHPGAPKGGKHEIVSFEGDPAASPGGWVGPAPTTAGNNVLAFTDWSWPKLAANGTAPVVALAQFNPVPEVMPVAPTRSFDFAFNDSWNKSCTPSVSSALTGDVVENPSYALDRDASVTNIFYFGNRIHDFSYKYGFTEKFGNMQLDNFGKGGKATDPVRFMAMAGILNGQLDNAFMFTPADGGEPQDLVVADPADPAGSASSSAARVAGYIPPFSGMFLWRPVPTFQAPCVDGDLDASTAYHEYTHGISNRMTGGPDDADALSAHQSGSMGEAWSDWVAHVLLDSENLEDRTADGIYVTGNSVTGIRHFRLDANPLTYGDIGFGRFGPEVHDDGEIWSGTLWDLRSALVKKYGKSGGLDRVAHLVFDGLATQARLPDMLDARDAILRAGRTRYKGADEALIWQVFASRGMGRSARSVDANDTNPRPAFDAVASNGYLAGTIRDAGGAGMSAKILVGLSEGKPTPVVVTARSGSYRIPMAPGRYPVSVAAPGYGIQRIGTVSVAAGRTTTLKPVNLNRNLASIGWGALVTGGLADGDPGTGLIDDHEFTGQVVEVGKPVVVQLAGTNASCRGYCNAPATVRAVSVSPKPAGAGTSQNPTGYKVELSADGSKWTTVMTGGVKRTKPRPVAAQWVAQTKALPGVAARFARITVTSSLTGSATAVLSGIQVYGTAPGMAVAPMATERPFVDPDGFIAAANAAGPDASVTFNEFSSTCSAPATQGLDAYVVELPAGAGDGVHMFATKGGHEIARDLDTYFYDEACQPTGSIASGSADEAGPIPPGSHWVVIVLYAGTTDGFFVNVASTLERVSPPPGTPTRAPYRPRVGRVEQQQYISIGGDVFNGACLTQFFDLPEPYAGGACFELRSGDRSVRGTVTDDLTENTSGFYAFRDVDGNTIGETEIAFCGSFSASVPPGAVDLAVWVDELLATQSECGGSPATTGVVTATFA